MARLKVFFDGGCRPNPGRMELAVVAAGRTSLVRDAGQGTSADAEWLALIHALGLALDSGAAEFVLLGDSASVVAQASGVGRCPASARHHLDALHRLAGATRLRIRHVGRSKNLAGIALATLHPR
jgi:ribonuclease HI